MLRNKDVEIEELKDVITQETQLIQDKDMELQSKSMELDALKNQLQEIQKSTQITSSIQNLSITEHNNTGPREGWLEIPSTKGLGERRERGGWTKTYVVLAERKLFFYAGQSEHKTHQPKMIIDLDKVCILDKTICLYGIKNVDIIYEGFFMKFEGYIFCEF